MQSTIRLFKALPISEHTNGTSDGDLDKSTLKKGFIFSPEVITAYPDREHLIGLVDEVYGHGSEELNASFHKSFAKVRDSSMGELVFEQIMHYFTTYGAENSGAFTHENVYIPTEEFNIPELKDGISVVVIRGLTKQEIKNELMKLLSSGMALHERTVADAIDVAQYVGFNESDINGVKNKEVKVALYDHFGIVPSLPIEFLRFIIYRATTKTLVIKSRSLIEELKTRNNNDLVRYFDNYEKDVGLQNLAKIFYRYKPIFLALRANTALKKHINKIRRLAPINHEPMAEDLLNTITARLERREAPTVAEFKKALQDANIFRKIRLAYALKFRTTEADSILYKVRNGKSFAKEFDFKNKQGAERIYNLIIKSIVSDVAPNIEGKTYYIPPGIKYGLPATDKQFTGNLPSGTCVETNDGNMVVGVHWTNVKSHRIDLDLSLSNNLGKIGWDGSYRDTNNETYFSGDMTDAPAPNGATEAFLVGGNARGTWLMNLNYYNFNNDVDVPYKLFVSRDSKNNIEKNYTVNPNKILALSNSVMDVHQKTIGILVADENGKRFYFSEAEFDKNASARNDTIAEQARKYLINFYTDTISLNEIIEMAGGKVIDAKMPKGLEDESVIDLSPEAVDKTTFMDMLVSNE
jgi:hypothetical protein